MHVNWQAMMNDPRAGYRYADELDVLVIYNNPDNDYFAIEGFCIRTIGQLRQHFEWASKQQFPITQTFGDGQEVELDDYYHYISHFTLKLMGPEFVYKLNEAFSMVSGDFGYVLWLGDFDDTPRQ